MPSGSSRLEGTVQKERCIAGGGGGGGTADPNEAQASPAWHPEERRPQSSPTAKPLHDHLACILPLYEWLSLGDGEIGAVETAIRNRSISGQFIINRLCCCCKMMVMVVVVTARTKSFCC